METTVKRRERKKRDWVKKVDIPRGCAVLKGTARVDYLVSPHGEVFGHDLKRNKYYRISQKKTRRIYYNADGTIRLNKKEYLSVSIILYGIHQWPLVHRLIAKIFCKNDDPKHKTQVDHLDGNHLNNDYRNLEWVTPEENRRRMRESKGWKPYSEDRLRRARAARAHACAAHKARKQRLQESNLFNN